MIDITPDGIIAGLLLLLCITANSYYCFAIYAAIEFFSHSKNSIWQPSRWLKPGAWGLRPQPGIPPLHPVLTNPALAIEYHPPVSVLKPVCGLSSEDYNNLASFCNQDYPAYEIIFGIQDTQDSSIAIVKQLIEEFPTRDIRFVVSDRILGSNLKVNNLASAAVAAKYDILVLADSDIDVEPDYLTQIVQPLQNSDVGVVTCMYRSRTEGWLSSFEALSISTDFLPSVLVARKLEGMSFALGATIVIKKTVLEAIGGFASVANYLGDDFRLGYLPAQAGYQVVLSAHVVDHVMSTTRWRDFIHHQTRWNRNNRFARPGGYLGLIFTYGVVASSLLCLLLHGSWLGWTILGVTWSLRLIMAWIVGIQYLRDPVALNWFWLIPLRDFCSFALWCYSFWGDTVEWRGRRLKLTKNGELI